MRLTTSHKLSLAAGLAGLIILCVLGVLVYRASPGPEAQDILGVSLGRFGSDSGVAYLSGRRIDCIPQADPPYTSVCSVTIAGQPLVIQAFRNGPEALQQLSGGCSATYAGQTWACEIGSRHVHVHWFAHISEPLGLTGDQMDALRRQYFFENVPEASFGRSVLFVPIMVMLLTLGVLTIWRRPSRGREWIETAGAGLLVLIGTFVIVLKLTNGFWD